MIYSIINLASLAMFAAASMTTGNAQLCYLAAGFVGLACTITMIVVDMVELASKK